MQLTFRTWFVAATLVMVFSTSAVAADPSTAAEDNALAEFAAEAEAVGFGFASLQDAEDAIALSGIPSDMAVDLIRSKGKAAMDYFLPLTFEEVSTGSDERTDHGTPTTMRR